MERAGRCVRGGRCPFKYSARDGRLRDHSNEPESEMRGALSSWSVQPEACTWSQRDRFWCRRCAEAAIYRRLSKVVAFQLLPIWSSLRSTPFSTSIPLALWKSCDYIHFFWRTTLRRGDNKGWRNDRFNLSKKTLVDLTTANISRRMADVVVWLYRVRGGVVALRLVGFCASPAALPPPRNARQLIFY